MIENREQTATGKKSGTYLHTRSYNSDVFCEMQPDQRKLKVLPCGKLIRVPGHSGKNQMLFCQNGHAPALSSIMTSELVTDPFNSVGVPTSLLQIAFKNEVTFCYILDI